MGIEDDDDDGGRMETSGVPRGLGPPERMETENCTMGFFFLWLMRRNGGSKFVQRYSWPSDMWCSDVTPLRRM